MKMNTRVIVVLRIIINDLTNNSSTNDESIHARY